MQLRLINFNFKYQNKWYKGAGYKKNDQVVMFKRFPCYVKLRYY